MHRVAAHSAPLRPSSCFFSSRPSGVYLVIVSRVAYLHHRGQDLLEQLLDEVDMGHDHASAAVALETQLVHSITIIYQQKFLGGIGKEPWSHPSFLRGSLMSSR